MSSATDHLGKLIGNTGSPTNLRVALRGSFSARRGEFVRMVTVVAMAIEPIQLHTTHQFTRKSHG